MALGKTELATMGLRAFQQPPPQSLALRSQTPALYPAPALGKLLQYAFKWSLSLVMWLQPSFTFFLGMKSE